MVRQRHIIIILTVCDALKIPAIYNVMGCYQISCTAKTVKSKTSFFCKQILDFYLPLANRYTWMTLLATNILCDININKIINKI